MRLSLVVPCYNEVEVIERFHQALSHELAATGRPYEIVYVDDGSTDGTLDTLVKLAATDESVRYLSFSRNFGKEAAMLAGLRYATGDAVVIMDADLQHPPELVGRMLEQYERGFDQVIARRTRTGDPATRTLFARAYYWLINRWADVELIDGVGDFRLLSRRAVDGLLELGEYNRFSKGLFAWIGFESILFEYENVKQSDRKSRWTFRRLLEYGLDGLLSFNNRPLRLAIYVGLLLTAVAAGYAVWVIVNAALNGVEMPGYVTLIAAITGLGGLQMVMLGRDRRVHRPDLLRDQAAPALPAQAEQRGPDRSPRHPGPAHPAGHLDGIGRLAVDDRRLDRGRAKAPGGRTTRGLGCTSYRRSGGQPLLGRAREQVQLVRHRREADGRALLDRHPGVDPGDDLLVLVVVLRGAVQVRVGTELLDHGDLHRQAGVGDLEGLRPDTQGQGLVVAGLRQDGAINRHGVVAQLGTTLDQVRRRAGSSRASR